MKKDNYMRTLTELAKMKGNGKKTVIWSLSPKAKEHVMKMYPCEEYLYEIQTKHLVDIRNIKNEKLKEQHFAFKQKKKSIVRMLAKEDKEELERMGIKYRPVKYLIHLR